MLCELQDIQRTEGLQENREGPVKRPSIEYVGFLCFIGSVVMVLSIHIYIYISIYIYVYFLLIHIQYDRIILTYLYMVLARWAK